MMNSSYLAEYYRNLAQNTGRQAALYTTRPRPALTREILDRYETISGTQGTGTTGASTTGTTTGSATPALTETSSASSVPAYITGLQGIVSPSGYVPDKDWEGYVSNLYSKDYSSYQGLAKELFGIGAKGVWRTEGAGGTGADDLFINAAYNPFRSPEEWETALARNAVWRGENSQNGANPLTLAEQALNPIGTWARSEGVDTGAQNALDIAYNLGSLGGALALHGTNKMINSKGNVLESIGEGLDAALDPLEVDYYFREAGKELPEGIRSNAKNIGSTVGGIVGSYFPVVGTAAGAAIGTGIGSKLAGESYGSGLVSSAQAYATRASVNKLFGISGPGTKYGKATY